MARGRPRKPNKLIIKCFRVDRELWETLKRKHGKKLATLLRAALEEMK